MWMWRIQILLTISSNLLREPENEKFHKFKPTNNMIKTRLVDQPGALEYAIAVGSHSLHKRSISNTFIV